MMGVEPRPGTSSNGRDRGPELVFLLQVLVAVAGLIVFFGVVGALLRGVAFDALGLPRTAPSAWSRSAS
jgi:hypothetical protein